MHIAQRGAEGQAAQAMYLRKAILPMLLAVTAMVLMSGCLGLHFGGGTRSSVQNRTQTYDVSLGQQLIDLQKAYEAGIITEREYKSQKKKLLKHYVER